MDADLTGSDTDFAISRRAGAGSEPLQWANRIEMTAPEGLESRFDAVFHLPFDSHTSVTGPSLTR